MNQFIRNQASSSRFLWDNIIVHNPALPAQPPYLILYLPSKQHRLSKHDFCSFGELLGLAVSRNTRSTELIIRNNTCFIRQKWKFARWALQPTFMRVWKSLVERWEAQIRQELQQYFQTVLFFVSWCKLWVYFTVTKFVSTYMFRTVIVSICLSAWTIPSENIRFLPIPFSFKTKVSVKLREHLHTDWSSS